MNSCSAGVCSGECECSWVCECGKVLPLPKKERHKKECLHCRVSELEDTLASLMKFTEMSEVEDV